MSDTYELIGHNFWARHTDIALVHGLAFSISLRLPTNSYWVAYYIWLEKGSGWQTQNMDLHSVTTDIIARGINAPRTYRVFPGG
jgi:hypothetical protein